jgi:hypothetical protein
VRCSPWMLLIRKLNCRRYIRVAPNNLRMLVSYSRSGKLCFTSDSGFCDVCIQPCPSSHSSCRPAQDSTGRVSIMTMTCQGRCTILTWQMFFVRCITRQDGRTDFLTAIMGANDKDKTPLNLTYDELHSNSTMFV